MCAGGERGGGQYASTWGDEEEAPSVAHRQERRSRREVEEVVDVDVRRYVEQMEREDEDAHCHPTDDPSPWRDSQELSLKMRSVKLNKVCAMSTSVHDQHFVAQLARSCPGKVVPAFGYHPWFAHQISLCDSTTKEDHYRSLFLAQADADAGTSSRTLEAKNQLEDLLPHLPPPIALSDIIQTLRRNLQEHPTALVGEVGMDRIFRLPMSAHGYTRDPTLSCLSTPLSHQLSILSAQVQVAISLRRSVSLHSVKAGDATLAWVREMDRRWPGSGRRTKHVDLHSCSLSAEMIRTNAHPNIYISFSLTINARQKSLAHQIRACRADRLLVESDWHSAHGLSARTWAALRFVADIKQELRQGEERGSEAGYEKAAYCLRSNWNRFIRGE
ncbi:Metallo-dependent hydrolase [Ceraceosorus guamensis]|uniref:Metallo-dependent hydrolase n=1 Tax=Ceraceosorus guamensis TaxID=1522189 RepID=A0A316VUY7_9BASI|nr:Metallo-dependent hydrolase [Ceraceosorus guamensis]PWN41436.1 Metallo-dependent hydrolase [Ceraceosorus guamensis]